MSNATSDERRRSFDAMAEQYARARPSGPPALFDALVAYVAPPAQVLEIGCGPGNATLPLLERGYRIRAVELGENLAAFARQRLAAFPFTVEVGKFEDASLEPASVDLVFCASAFHWLDRDRALRQLVKVLRPGGGFALQWGSPRHDLEDPRVDQALQAAYRVHAPELVHDVSDTFSETVEIIAAAIRATPELRDFEERRFPLRDDLRSQPLRRSPRHVFGSRHLAARASGTALRRPRRDHRPRLRRQGGAPRRGAAAALAAAVTQ